MTDVDDGVFTVEVGGPHYQILVELAKFYDKPEAEILKEYLEDSYAAIFEADHDWVPHPEILTAVKTDRLDLLRKLGRI